MNKSCLQYFLTKTSLAAVAAAVTLIAAPSAHADTSWVAGENWNDNTSNPNDGNAFYPVGISNGMSTAQAAAVADTIASDDRSVGINFVRTCINPATITSNWPVVQAYVNELTNDGLNVDLCCFYENSSGTIVNMNLWQSMWQTIDGVYSGSGMVYYEPINEPHGYSSESVLATDVYVPFLGFIHKSQNHLILDGTGYADHIATLGSDSRFNGCLLGIHDYGYWNTSWTSESQWENDLYGKVNGYQSRTIMTEFGADATSGLNYGIPAANYYIASIRGFVIECHSLRMGSVFFTGHTQTVQAYRLFETPGGGLTNPTLLEQLEYGWGGTSGAVADVCDFTGYGNTDFSIFRPSNGWWYSYNGPSGQYGTNTDIAVPADYLGVGSNVFAVCRTPSYNWYITGGGITQYGTTGDIPVPADYLGNGKAQIAVFRPSSGNWYITGGGITQFGANGDIPVPGYYNGDGHADIAVYRPSNCTWYIKGGATVQFGTSGDIPVPGDYDGTGKTQIAVFHPADGTWHFYNGDPTIQYGQDGDVPVPGDYLGNDRTQIAVWRPSVYVWFVNGVQPGITWGTANDVPLPLPYAIRHYCLGYHN